MTLIKKKKKTKPDEYYINQTWFYLLSPSIHQAFSPSESLYREVYEEAELQGFLGHNCVDLYYQCPQDLLSSITNVITHVYHST